MGGSSSKSESESQATTQDSVWGGQTGALGNLYDQAATTFGNQDQSKMYDMANNISPYMDSTLDSASEGQNYMMGGGAIGDTSDIRAKLMGSMGQPSQTGKMYESIVGGQGNTYIDPMVKAMKDGAMENNAMLQSGTAMDAAAMGQGGSSRHAMQNAMTNRATNRDMLTQETNMRGNAYDTDLNMKMDIAKMADSNNQLEQDRMVGMLNQADSNVNQGTGYSNNMQNLGMGTMAPWLQAMQSPWDSLNNYAGVVGGPTILGSGSQSGSSKASAAGGGMMGG